MQEKDWEDETGERFVFRHRPATVYALDELLSGTLFFQTRENLNDPGELVYQFKDGEDLPPDERRKFYLQVVNLLPDPQKSTARHYLAKTFASEGLDVGNAKLEQLMEGILPEVRKKCAEVLEQEFKRGICCFTKAGMDPTMIAHYGDNSGLVIAYSRGVGRIDAGDALSDVVYGELPPVISAFKLLVSDDPSEHEQFWAHKSSPWKYEKELRLISDGFGPHPKQVGSEHIRGACLMPKADESFTRLVKSICRERSIALFKIDAGDAYKYVAKKVGLAETAEQGVEA